MLKRCLRAIAIAFGGLVSLLVVALVVAIAAPDVLPTTEQSGEAGTAAGIWFVDRIVDIIPVAFFVVVIGIVVAVLYGLLRVARRIISGR